MFQRELVVSTHGQGLTDLTPRLRQLVCESQLSTGLCSVFVQHTSASLVIQENADPSVQRDLQNWLSELAPESARWEHCEEGPDDMPAHARAAITHTSESIPIVAGKLGLGQWQGVYLWEHRRSAHERHLIVHLSGE